MTSSSLLKAPPRADNDARNLFILTLPTLLGLLCLLGLILLEVTVSKAFLSNNDTFWTQITNGTGSGGLCSTLTSLD